MPQQKRLDHPAETATVRRILVTLVSVTMLVAAVSFALTAYGLFGYGREVWKLPIGWSLAVPLMVDLQSISAGIGTYALRDAHWRTRFYAWSVFIGGSVISVLGNEAFAQHRDLTLYGRLGSALPPVFLASAVHLVIVVRRHLERVASRPAGQPPGEPVANPKPDNTPDTAVPANNPQPERVPAPPKPEPAERAPATSGGRRPAAGTGVSGSVRQRPARTPAGLTERAAVPAGDGWGRDEQGRVVGSKTRPARTVDGVVLTGDDLKRYARGRVTAQLAAGGDRKGLGAWASRLFDPPMGERWGQLIAAEVFEVADLQPDPAVTPDRDDGPEVVGVRDGRRLGLVGLPAGSSGEREFIDSRMAGIL